jgi:RNA-directed DNA polymerase
VLDDLDKQLERRGLRFCRCADDCNIYVRSRRAGERVMASVSRFLTCKLKLKVNETKSAVARPEERKFLGFSIANDGSERRIARKALDRFKMRIRDLTRRTRGEFLPQIVEGLRPYLIGWRSYFGFCQTPIVLTDLEAWIRRRLRMYLWRQWRNGCNRFRELRRRGVPKFLSAVAAGSPTGLYRRCKWRCATTSSTPLACPASTSPAEAQPDRTVLVRTRMPGGVGGVGS